MSVPDDVLVVAGLPRLPLFLAVLVLAAVPGVLLAAPDPSHASPSVISVLTEESLSQDCCTADLQINND